MIINANETKLTNREAVDFFGNAACLGGTQLLYALFRAIVINHDDCTDLKAFKSKTRIGCHTVSDHEEVECVLKGEDDEAICLLIYSGNFQFVKPEIAGWVTFDEPPYYLNRYLSQTTRTKVYINREKKKVVAVIDRGIDGEWVQAFSSMLWIILPWYYPEKNDDIIKFFKSISIGNKNVTDEEAKKILIDYVNTAADKLNIRDAVLHQKLDGLADRARKEQIQIHQNSVESIREAIQQYTDILVSKYENLSNELSVLQGLEQMEPKTDEAFFQFFRQHQNVRVGRVRGAELCYSVIDTLEFYDEDEANTLFDNGHAWVHEFPTSFVEMLRTIFVEKRGIFRVCAEFKITDMKLVSSRKGILFDKESIPNPHIYFYGCDGANETFYSQYARQGDWDLAIEQSIAATKNWAVGDSVVGKKMFSWIRECSGVKCIYVTDGSPMDGVTPECKLISFDEYEALVTAKKAEEAKESEVVDNG